MKDGDRGFSLLFFADGLFLDDELFSGDLQKVGFEFRCRWRGDCSPIHKRTVAAKSQPRDDDHGDLGSSPIVVSWWPHCRAGSWSGLRRLTAEDVRERSSGLLAHTDITPGFSRASQRFDGRLRDLNDFLSPSDGLEKLHPVDWVDGDVGGKPHFCAAPPGEVVHLAHHVCHVVDIAWKGFCLIQDF